MAGYIDPDWIANEPEEEEQDDRSLFMQCMILIGEPPGRTPRVAGDGPGRAALAQHDRCRSCMLDLERPWRTPEAPPPGCCDAGCDVFEFVAAAREQELPGAASPDDLADPCAYCPSRGRWNPVKRAFDAPTCSGACSKRYSQARGATPS